MLLDFDPVYSYFYVKAALIEIFGRIQDHQLLHACDLGNRKPTELLAEMRKLLGAKGSSVLLKKLFMDRLRSNVRPIFLAGPMDNLGDLACAVAEDRPLTPVLWPLQINFLPTHLLVQHKRSTYFAAMPCLANRYVTN